MIEFNPEVLEVRMWKIVEEQIQALQQENEELKAQMKDRTCVVCGKFIASDICHIVPLGRTCWNEECFEKGKDPEQNWKKIERKMLSALKNNDIHGYQQAHEQYMKLMKAGNLITHGRKVATGE